MLTDSHCHLDSAEFDADRAEVLARARAAGINRILIPGVDIASSRKAVALAASDPMLFAAVGIHPGNALQVHPTDWDELETLARQPKVVAIGEIGLDYAWEHIPAARQQEVLQRQLNLAARLGLPVILHLREARRAQTPACARDLLAMVQQWIETRQQDADTCHATRRPDALLSPGVFHAFSASLDMAQTVIRLGFFIGVAGPVTFQNSRRLQEIVAALPLEHILLETDSPVLSPHPYRGQRNEPARLRLIADKIGLLHHHTIAEVAAITTENARRLFGWE